MTSLTTRPTTQEWREAFERLERSPWPGPRPLRSTDPQSWLCGRDQDCEKFRREVDAHTMVFLAGDSGVGKTSLLHLGLVPVLQSNGYAVAACSRWGGVGQTGGDAPYFLGEQVRLALAEQEIDLAGRGGEALGELARRFGSRGVIILDQFEELIRDEPTFAGKLFETLGTLNQRTPLKLVVSLRSEYVHRLRPLERLMRPLSMSHFFLGEVEASAALEVANVGRICDGPDAHNEVSRPAIAPEAAETVASHWQSARHLAQQSAGDVGTVPLGLLHLQALLYSLHADVSASGGQTQISQGDVDAYFGQSVSSKYALSRFEAALQRTVSIKLHRCETAAEAVGVDHYLRQGVVTSVALMVDHLSSAGYKLVRDAWELFAKSRDADLASLVRGMARSSDSVGGDPDGWDEKIDPPSLRGLLALLIEDLTYGRVGDQAGGDHARIDPLSATLEDVAKRADEDPVLESVPWSSRLRPQASSFAADRAEVTAGPMLGLAPAAVLIEELRRFAIGLEWLQTAALARVTAVEAGASRVALIHDGFGAALELWSPAVVARPAAAMTAITAAGGVEYRWASEPNDEASGNLIRYRKEFDGGDSFRHFVNLRWRATTLVDTAFRCCVFVNCDFRGALFLRCTFEGVTFVNCLMDGVIFSDCLVVGLPSPRPDVSSDSATAYQVPDSAVTAQALSHYRAIAAAHAVVSDLPGLPAIPGSEDREISLGTGGLVLWGGRISSLLIRGTQFKDDGKFCVRDAAGSGMDIVEQLEAASFEFTGCAIRHLTCSVPLNRDRSIGAIVIEAYDCSIVQAWLGQHLRGEFAVKNSLIVDIRSASSELKATASDGCRYADLVGVHVDNSCEPLPGDRGTREFTRDDAALFERLSGSLDYRRSMSDDPAVRRRLERIAEHGDK